MDLGTFNSHIDNSLSVMGEAVNELQNQISALATAKASGDTAAYEAGLERLRQGAANLKAAVDTARQARS